MTKKVEVGPEGVRTAAKSATDIADLLTSIANAGRRAGSAGESAWGDDSFGSQFADGSQGFAKGYSNMAKGTDSLAASFANLATGMETTAQRLEAIEQANTAKFK
ncbi:hypothetical protein [Nocardia jejuensis]|uniref:hypothetical protein n=1 Tax=Nocardia jejuensis TaxID=328049 RepID=UPI00082B3174|nr:hypothetical protein [Nocardia jejuensis]